MSKSRRILLAVMPYDGEVMDRITPKFYKNKAVKYMPLGVLSIAANLTDEHEVHVLDAASLNLSLDETIARIEAYAPDILGLSVVTYRAWAMTQILARTSAPVKVVGGPHATNNARSILALGADAVFVGDAELTFPQWLRDGCPSGIVTSAPVPLDGLRFPARRLMSLDDYRIEPNEDMLFNVGALRLPMYSSKGCPHKCIYCDVQQKTYNFKSAARCAEEFLELIDLGVTSIHILDDAFNIRRDRVIELCAEIRKNRIDVDWSARGTVEVHEEVIAALAEAGCRRLHVGIESLDDATLTYFKKGCRFEQIERFAGLCRKYHIDIIGYFIIGVPGETEEYRRTLPYRVADLGIRYPYFNIMSPLAETPFYDSMRAQGVISRDVWAEFAANPVPDFVIPAVRSDDEERHLQRTIDGYIAMFKREQSSVLIS